jgi:hypothetical protein
MDTEDVFSCGIGVQFVNEGDLLDVKLIEVSLVLHNLICSLLWDVVIFGQDLAAGVLNSELLFGR